MAENPTDILEDVLPVAPRSEVEDDDSIPLAEGDDLDFDDFPAETDEEIIAGLAESEKDVAAGRVRPFREAARDIATRLGIQLED